MENGLSAVVEWRDDRVPVSTRFADPYFSLNDGAAETTHVFLSGNGLPQRFAPGFHIAELGFGTGLNLLVAWKAWEDAGMIVRSQPSMIFHCRKLPVSFVEIVWRSVPPKPFKIKRSIW